MELALRSPLVLIVVAAEDPHISREFQGLPRPLIPIEFEVEGPPTLHEYHKRCLFIYFPTPHFARELVYPLPLFRV